METKSRTGEQEKQPSTASKVWRTIAIASVVAPVVAGIALAVSGNTFTGGVLIVAGIIGAITSKAYKII